jgi:UbiA prenyltransferase family
MKSLVEGLRTLLILGRVSNLPTVWSNLLAGWFLAGEGSTREILLPLLFGASFLYIGGMYLNDFCDADFDAQFCRQRPIPAGKISRRVVGILAGLWFASGLACLLPSGGSTIEVALLLLAGIVFYDFRHKNVSWAPLVMGACRFLLYPLAASIFSGEISWLVILWGVTLGLYVAGITYLARGESRPGKPARWALILLLLPGVMAVFVCVRSYFLLEMLVFLPPLIFAALQFGWMAWLLVPFWRKTNRSIGRVVSGLLAGIVLVDGLAVSPLAGLDAAWLLPLFILALLLQRVIPAT